LGGMKGEIGAGSRGDLNQRERKTTAKFGVEFKNRGGVLKKSTITKSPELITSRRGKVHWRKERRAKRLGFGDQRGGK